MLGRSKGISGARLQSEPSHPTQHDTTERPMHSLHAWYVPIACLYPEHLYYPPCTGQLSICMLYGLALAPHPP